MKRRTAPCSCAECARLDLDFPGEGLQLRLPIAPLPHRGGQPTHSARQLEPAR